MKKKIILSAGGTGGHLFPAQATASELSDLDILFVGGKLSKCKFFDSKQFSFKEVSCSSLTFFRPLKFLSGAFSIIRGIFQSLKVFKEFEPVAVVGFGSYHTLPVLVAALIKRIPIILHEQNSSAGKVNRLFSRYAKNIGVTFPNTFGINKEKSILTSYPLREKNGQAAFLKNQPLLLIFGGSQGAKALNRIIFESASSLKHFYLFHITGNEEDQAIAHRLYKELDLSYQIKVFEPEIRSVMDLADIVIARAGASTIMELTDAEAPALLIPFPKASENHQFKNAFYFTDSIGGGKLLEEKNLNREAFLKEVNSVYRDREINKQNMRKYKEKAQFKSLSQIIRESL